MAQRFVIEGEWSGYTSVQRRVVHRTVHEDPGLRTWARHTHAITYTDGTQLELNCFDVDTTEPVKEIHGYDSLIRDCREQNVTSVAALRSK